MKTNQNLRRLGEKKGSNNKISHAELDGGAPRTFASSTHAVAVNDNNLRGRFRIKYGMTIANNRAFTLIELLVVVLIIGILASVALPQYQLAVDKSKYTRLMPLVQAIKNAQEVYYLEHGKYADSLEQLDISTPWGGPNSPDGSMMITLINSHYVYGTIGQNYVADNAYLLWYDHSGTPGRRECYAYTGARSERLCKAVTGHSLYNSCDGACKAVAF